MRNIFASLLLLCVTPAAAQVGSVASTCIWSGTLADCLPSAGILLRNQRDVRFGEASGSGSNYVAIQAPATLAGDVTLTLPVDDGDANEFLQTNGSGVTSWEPVDASTDITGILPLANGGTNKNATAVAGGIVWSDADSLEITSAGTASDWVLSGGTATPTMSSTTTTAKTIDGSADAIQLTVQGNGTQTSNILTVENSAGTDLLGVTATEGTDIRGTTTNDAAASTDVGYYDMSSRLRSAATSLTTNTGANIALIDVPAGDWWIGASFGVVPNAATSITKILMSISLTSATVSATDTLAVPTAGEFRAVWPFAAFVPNEDIVFSTPVYRVSVASTTRYYLVGSATFTINSLSGYGSIWIRRAR
jgi:hypothetical protein